MRCLALVPLLAAAAAAEYFNPIFTGFNPDPSCIYVDETFFCVTSTFTWFPGVPVYASKDLQSWKLASHVLNRREQVPQLANAPTGQDGLYASTIRHHNGTFYVTTTYLSFVSYKDFTTDNLIFSTNDPYNASSWSIPTYVDFVGYDPSLLFDDDGTVYFTGAAALSTGTAIALATIDVESGALGPISYPWNGTGIGTSEGPHLYRKGDWYYILVAEGGTEKLHRGSIARSSSVTGPYESNPANPIVITENLNASYIQSVGHADLFQDETTGAWWGVALASRSGPEFESYPMGRETVLFPVSWPGGDGSWPAMLEPVRGRMNASLPGQVVNVSTTPSTGGEPDIVDFEPNSALPAHWLHIRYPDEAAYSVSAPGHTNSLQLALSPRNLSSSISPNSTLSNTVTFLGRRQTDTLFSFSVDMAFEPRTSGEEAGVSVYLDEKRHIDFAIVAAGNGTNAGRQLRLRSLSSNDATVPDDVFMPVTEKTAADSPMRLEIQAINATHYAFLAGVGGVDEDAEMTIVGYSLSSLVSGGYTGTVVGVYGTTNGKTRGNSTSVAHVSRWRYLGKGQYIDHDVVV